MGKFSVKENKDAFQIKRESLGYTREDVSMILEEYYPISADKLEKIENDRVNMNPKEALALSKAYLSPELCNYYCINKCAIGTKYSSPIKIRELSSMVVEMLSSLNAISSKKERLIDIVADGEISDDELRDFAQIRLGLKRIAAAADSLNMWTEKMISDGTIDEDAYNKILDELE